MRITRRQLRRTIQEAVSDDAFAMMFGAPAARTPEDMIKNYTTFGRSGWITGSRLEYTNMAEGGQEYGLRQEYYSKGGTGPSGAWSDQDFQQVIDAVDAKLGTLDEDEEDEDDLEEGEFQIVQAKVAPSKEIAKGHSSGAGSFTRSAQQGKAQASTMNVDPVTEGNRMRLTKRQLRQIIREEAGRLSEDRIKRELENLRKNIRDDEAHIDNLEKDIEDERKEAERARREEGKKDEGVRVTRSQLRRMIRELDT